MHVLILNIFESFCNNLNKMLLQYKERKKKGQNISKSTQMFGITELSAQAFKDYNVLKKVMF
jgi:hypothetical protein